MSSVYRCLWKIFKTLSKPAQTLILDTLTLFLVEFFKFCLTLLLIFAIAYSIFYFWHNHEENSEVKPPHSERLSAGLMESFSKYPYVIEMSSKQSTESMKTSKKLKSSEKHEK